MDVHAKLAEVRQVVEGAKGMPMSASAMVNRGELLALLDDLREGLDTALSDARKVLADRDGIVEDARSEADQLMAEAREERERILSDTEVFRLAKRKADELLENAHGEADGLRQETDDYVDQKLANFEITLERTIEAVRRGRERLAGRTAFDSLTPEEADKIVLPEHLEG